MYNNGIDNIFQTILIYIGAPKEVFSKILISPFSSILVIKLYTLNFSAPEYAIISTTEASLPHLSR